VVATAAPAQAAVTVRLRAAVADLPVAAETRAGYARSKFPHWADADRDCQDTRSEVLRAESKRAVTGACRVATGKWVSYYDKATWMKASDVDIDHLVPLAEAWDSGAKAWNAATRKRFANDLGDRRTLVAVTDNVNQAKGDRDPAQWLPPKNRCRYVTEWVAVKIRWSLKVDRAEKRALTRQANGCTNTTITVTRARIVKGTGGGPAPAAGRVPTRGSPPAPTRRPPATAPTCRAATPNTTGTATPMPTAPSASKQQDNVVSEQNSRCTIDNAQNPA
jgi:hypothetical protein